LITRVETDTKNEKRLDGFWMTHQAPENVYGNQNCNSATVAHDGSSVPHGGE
jgi:hypothetical protein